MNDLKTAAEVGIYLGITAGRVRVLARSRKLGQMVGHLTVFTPEDIDAMRVRTPGRPINRPPS